MFVLQCARFLLERLHRVRLGRNFSATPTPRVGNPTGARLPFEVDTNVAKHTELFRHDNFSVFTALRVFTVTQVFLWTYLAHFTQTLLKDPNLLSKLRSEAGTLKKKSFLASLTEKLTTDKYRNSLTWICVIFGNVIVVASTTYMLRSVRSVVLLKGGRQVYIQTYAPFRSLRGFEVPLEHLNCLQSRSQRSSYISLKVKGRWFYFMLDQRGLFPHPRLFDQTVGMARTFK